jgi:hypothetical protein
VLEAGELKKHVGESLSVDKLLVTPMFPFEISR